MSEAPQMIGDDDDSFIPPSSLLFCAYNQQGKSTPCPLYSPLHPLQRPKIPLEGIRRIQHLKVSAMQVARATMGLTSYCRYSRLYTVSIQYVFETRISISTITGVKTNRSTDRTHWRASVLQLNYLYSMFHISCPNSKKISNSLMQTSILDCRVLN